MAMEVVGLGKLSLASKASGMSLELTTDAYFTSSNHEIDNSSRHLIKAAVSTGVTSRPWVRPGANFKVMFKLDFSSGTEGGDHGTLAATLSEALYYAALWKEFGLRPKTKELSLDHASLCHAFILQFEYLDLHQDISRPSPHKLAQVPTVRDIKPPGDVEMVDIHCIEFRCHFSGRTDSKRRRQDSHFDSSDPLQDRHEQISDTTHKFSHIDRTPKKSIGDSSSSPTACRNVASRRAKSTPEKTKIQHVDCSACHTGRSPRSSPSAVQAIAPKLKRSYIDADLEQATASTITSGVLQLFDAGIRSAISSDPRRILKSLQLASHESIRHLNDTLPSLFSPGYAASMSSRSIMLPTISHVLSHVGGRYARSVTLKTKLRELSRRHASRNEDLPDDQSSITTCLWKMMQSTLVDHRAAERLPLLQLNSMPESGSKSCGEQFVDQSNIGRKDPDTPRPEACSCCAGEALEAEDPWGVAYFNLPSFESLESGIFSDCTVSTAPGWKSSPESPLTRDGHVEMSEEDLLSLSGSAEELFTGGVGIPTLDPTAPNLTSSHDCISSDTTGALYMDLDEVLAI